MSSSPSEQQSALRAWFRSFAPRSVCALLLALALISCGEQKGTLLAPNEAQFVTAIQDSRRSEEDVNRLSSALAQAMRHPDVRADIRDAMRGSRITEHKLILQQYVASRRGARLMKAAAEAANTTVGELRAIVGRMPRMDFYMPFRSHRLTWRATQDVVLGVAMDVDATTLDAYTSLGDQVEVNGEEPVPEFAVLLIAPAERSSRRIRPQANTPGDVIQEYEDGEISGSVVWTDANGNSREIQLADMLGEGDIVVYAECNPEVTDCEDTGGGGSGGGGGTGGGAPADTTFLTHFEIFFDDGLSSSEVEFFATFSGDGSTGHLRFEGVEEDDPHYPDVPFIFRRIAEGSSETINVHVVETDQFSDDEKGDRDFDVGDRGSIRSIYRGTTLTTNVTLDWTPKSN